VDLDHESIWISYCPMPSAGLEPQHLGLFNSHHRLAAPVAPWARLKIGAGTPPVLTRHGWMIIYHGVSEMRIRARRTSVVLLSRGDGALQGSSPRCPLSFGGAGLEAELPQERIGTIPTSFSPPALTGATIWACRTASTFITEWPTTGSAWRVLIYRIPCRREESPPSRREKCNPPEVRVAK
jgi:hypothetical protein